MSPPYRSVALRPPLGGIVKRFSVQGQAPYTTADALNVWGVDWSAGDAGRDRIATRPGLTDTTGDVGGTPYGWCYAEWVNSGLKRGAAVASSNGVYLSTDGASWTRQLQQTSATDFCSCEVMLGYLYFARYSELLYRIDITGGAGAGSVVVSIDDPTNPTPSNCGIVVRHLDRLWLAGDESNPHLVYASAVGDPLDWDFSGVADGDAWSSASGEGGAFGSIVTALIPHTRDCLFVCGPDTISVLRGNPRAGEYDILTDAVGPLSQTSWCHDSNGNLWYMSRDGLYKIPPGCGDLNESISREALPDELVAINPGTSSTYCSVSYDPRFRCLWIIVDHPSSDPADAVWSYDLQSPRGAWWKHSLSITPRLGVTIKGASTPDKSAVVILVPSTGDAYQFDRDSAESISSHVYYGPFELGADGSSEGILHAIQALVATSSSPVSWSVHVGGTAEQALASSASFTGQDWAAGLVTWQHVRRRGAFAYVKAFGTGTDRICLEDINARWAPLGLRKGGAT